MQVWSLYTDHARSLNAIMLVGCIAAMTANMLTRWGHMNRRTRRVFMWIYLIFLNFVYGYVIVIRAHRPFNPSVFIATCCIFGLLVALLWHPEGDDKTIHDDNSIGSRFLFWLDRRVRAYKTRHNEEEK